MPWLREHVTTNDLRRSYRFWGGPIAFQGNWIRHSTVTLLLTTITEVLTDARHKQINIYLSTYLTYLPIDLSICICTYVWLTVITSTHAQHTLSLSLSLAHFTSSLHLQLHFTSLHVTPGHVTPLNSTHTPHVNVGRPSPLTRVLHTT